MKTVKYVVFRHLTHADMFNIYKPSGMEAGGGGQSYIDFPTARVPVSVWRRFFHGGQGVVVSSRAKGPSWTFPVHSIGRFGSQKLTIYQRRVQSFCIASQKVTSRDANRVRAWLPDNGFPAPEDPEDRVHQPSGVVIFIVRTVDEEYWAGWFQKDSPCRTEKAEDALEVLLTDKGVEGYAGFIDCTDSELELDETDRAKPFLTTVAGGVRNVAVGKRALAVERQDGRVKEKRAELDVKSGRRRSVSERRVKTEDELTADLFDDDVGASSGDQATKTRMQSVRVRNTKAAKTLKLLYNGRCQISGDRYGFRKKDGTPYCEAHHLIPLGAAGDDSPFNIIIVNPLIHRMLHYADVQGVDLGRISEGNTLDIVINGEQSTIRWHPKHAAVVRKAQEASIT